MKNSKVAFSILEDVKMAPRDHQFVKCHIVWDVKMEDFRRKARLVAGGHMTTAPAAVTYASVVTRETVRIALTLAALNDLQVKCGDVEKCLHYCTSKGEDMDHLRSRTWRGCGQKGNYCEGPLWT